MVNRERLVRKCLEGNDKSRKQLFDHLSPMLLSVCHRYAHSKTEAEDIFQETFLKIFENLHQLKDFERLEGWAKQIAVHEAIAFYKKLRRLILTEDSLAENMNGTWEDNSHQKLEMQELMKLIQQLPDKMRLVLNLYAIEGFKHEEIAEMLNISVGTSKSNLFDARKRLKVMMVDEKRKSI